MGAASTHLGAMFDVRPPPSPDLPPSLARPAARHAFCSRLRGQRERAGIPLSTIAQSTKVSASLFAGLECGDLSRWPGGLYRRAFFREYVAAIGLPVEPTVLEFVRLYEEEEETPREPDNPAAAPELAPLRLTLAGTRGWRPRVSRQRAMAAGIDAAVVLVVAALVAWSAGARVWTVAGLMALGYYPLATICFGRSAALWWLARARGHGPPGAAAASPVASPAVPRTRKPLRFVRIASDR